MTSSSPPLSLVRDCYLKLVSMKRLEKLSEDSLRVPGFGAANLVLYFVSVESILVFSYYSLLVKVYLSFSFKRRRIL